MRAMARYIEGAGFAGAFFSIAAKTCSPSDIRALKMRSIPLISSARSHTSSAPAIAGRAIMNIRMRGSRLFISCAQP